MVKQEGSDSLQPPSDHDDDRIPSTPPVGDITNKKTPKKRQAKKNKGSSTKQKKVEAKRVKKNKDETIRSPTKKIVYEPIKKRPLKRVSSSSNKNPSKEFKDEKESNTIKPKKTQPTKEETKLTKKKKKDKDRGVKRSHSFETNKNTDEIVVASTERKMIKGRSVPLMRGVSRYSSMPNSTQRPGLGTISEHRRRSMGSTNLVGGRGNGRMGGRGPGGRGLWYKSLSMSGNIQGPTGRPSQRSPNQTFSGSELGMNSSTHSAGRRRRGSSFDSSTHSTGRRIVSRQPSDIGMDSSTTHSAGRRRRGSFDSSTHSAGRRSSMTTSTHSAGRRSLNSSTHSGGRKGVLRQPSAMSMSSSAHSTGRNRAIVVRKDDNGDKMEESSRPGIGERDFSSAFAPTDGPDFPNDTLVKKGLRYLRILPPVENETPSHRKVRLFTWGAVILDFTAAIVSISTFNGVTTCCGEAIFDFAAEINWSQFIRITSYVYLTMLFLEIIPLFVRNIPLNLINPLFGFTITVTMFFDDRIFEAATMWLIEAAAIFCEVIVYRLKHLEYHQKESRIKECTEELNLRRTKSRTFVLENDSDDDSVRSFGDEIEDGESEQNQTRSKFSNTGDEIVDKFRIQRERRRLKESNLTEAKKLRYHFIATMVNVGLIFISLSLIIGIGKNGGLCIYHMQTPDPFNSDQLGICDKCAGTEGVCEKCDNDPEGTNHQCYYPYL